MNSAFTHIDLCMSAIIISMNFLYCADRETRTLTLLLAPDSNSEVSTISPHPHKRFVWAVLFFPQSTKRKTLFGVSFGSDPNDFTPQQVAPFGLAISLQGLNS